MPIFSGVVLSILFYPVYQTLHKKLYGYGKDDGGGEDEYPEEMLLKALVVHTFMIRHSGFGATGLEFMVCSSFASILPSYPITHIHGNDRK
jgi:hypothetical protein